MDGQAVKEGRVPELGFSSVACVHPARHHLRPPCLQSNIEVVCSLIPPVISIPLTLPLIFGETPCSRPKTSSGPCSRGRLGSEQAGCRPGQDLAAPGWGCIPLL